jgi:hypothetical protein
VVLPSRRREEAVHAPLEAKFLLAALILLIVVLCLVWTTTRSSAALSEAETVVLVLLCSVTVLFGICIFLYDDLRQWKSMGVDSHRKQRAWTIVALVFGLLWVFWAIASFAGTDLFSGSIEENLPVVSAVVFSGLFLFAVLLASTCLVKVHSPSTPPAKVPVIQRWISSFLFLILWITMVAVFCLVYVSYDDCYSSGCDKDEERARNAAISFAALAILQFLFLVYVSVGLCKNYQE